MENPTPAVAAPAVIVPAVTTETETPKPEGTDVPKEGETVQIPAAELATIRKALADANEEAKNRRLEIERRDREAHAAEEARLAKQGEFETLAKTRETERDEVKTQLQNRDERIQRYEAIVGQDLEARTKDWPKEVKDLIPSGENVDALTRLENINRLAPLAAQLMNAPARPGNGAGPVAVGARTVDDQAAKDASRRSFAF